MRIAKLERQKGRLQLKHFGHTRGRRALLRECYHRAAGASKEQEASRERLSVHGSWYDCLLPRRHFHCDEVADWRRPQDGKTPKRLRRDPVACVCVNSVC